jgi:amino acid transporter
MNTVSDVDSPRELTLASNAVGLREVLFQSATAISPAGALATSVVVGALYAGGALPLAVLFAFVPCLTVAVSIGQLAKHLPSAGSIYTYPARALHPSVGFLVGWGYALAAGTWGPTIGLIIAVQVAGVLTSGSGVAFHLVWIATFCAAAVVALCFGYFGVQVSAKAGTVLGALEIGIMLALAACLIVRAGSGNTLAPFSLRLATIAGYAGWAGIFAAAVYTIQAFVGFEAAAPLAEEARDPSRTITRGTLAACAAIGAFYIVTTYAAVVAFGPVRFETFAASPEHGSPWYALARIVWGSAWIVVFLAVLNSNVGGQNAFSTAATRTWYAMGRIHLLPRSLARVHPRWRSPHIAVLTQFAYTLIAGVLAGIMFGPVNGFILLATICTSIPIAVYVLINLSCTLYFLRVRRHEFRWFIHGVLPIVGIAFMMPVLATVLGIGARTWRFVAPLPYPVSLCGPILAAWFGVGVAYLAYVGYHAPQKLAQTATIFSDARAGRVTLG